MLNRKKKMAAVLAMLSAVTLLSGCGKNDSANQQVAGVPSNQFGWSNPIGGQFPGGMPGAGCGVLTAGGASLGFTNQISSHLVGNGASQQQAQMISPSIGQVAILQVQIQSIGVPNQWGGVAQVAGQIQITPQGAQALLLEAQLGFGGWNPYYPVMPNVGYGPMPQVQVCIGALNLTYNPLRGGVYLSGLPLPRSGLPHLYFQ
jgi:hypothetical protein